VTLLSRVAEQLYWAARYVERAEDTARIVNAYTEVVVDLPTSLGARWESLLAISGSRDDFDDRYPKADEASIIEYVVADPLNVASVFSSVERARDNLRASREVIPRLAWQVINDLHLFVSGRRAEAVSRRSRSRYLEHVVANAQRFTGVVDSILTHDETYWFLRLGQSIERADMTTRVIGVRAAALMGAAHEGPAGQTYDGVQWMGILRSLSALQMFHRSTRGPVSGPAVVGFLLLDRHFPRSVVANLHRVREALVQLPRGDEVMAAVARVFDVVSTVEVDGNDGDVLDHAADQIQVALGWLHDRIMETYIATSHAAAPNP
jgi:uncharacterized alpha-E superfamily protein